MLTSTSLTSLSHTPDSQKLVLGRVAPPWSHQCWVIFLRSKIYCLLAMLVQSPLDKKIDNSISLWVPSADISISPPCWLFKMGLKHLRVISGNSSHSAFLLRRTNRKDARPYFYYLSKELIIQMINDDQNTVE